MKILSILMGILLTMSLVYGAPPVPMPMIFTFTFSGAPIVGLDITLTYNSETITRTTNEAGAIMVDVGTGSPDFATARSGNPSTATLVVNYQLGSKSYALGSVDTPYTETFPLESNPVATNPCPSAHCGSCDCSSSGSYINQVTAEKCAVAFPCTGNTCPVTECTTTTCPEVPSCPAVTACEVCTTSECPEQGSLLGAVFGLILSFIVGGGVVYITFGTANKLRVKKINGVDEVQHQHPGISGYHSTNTVHTSPDIRHTKGELLPKYVKVEGNWKYQG